MKIILYENYLKVIIMGLVAGPLLHSSVSKENENIPSSELDDINNLKVASLSVEVTFHKPEEDAEKETSSSSDQ